MKDKTESSSTAHPARFRVFAYGLPGVTIGFTYMLTQLYLMKFTTDVLMLAPAVMGVILAISRIWDAVFDPLVGYLSDITRNRIGRRHVWITFGSVPLALSFIATFMPWPGLDTYWLTIWMAVSIVVFFTSLAAVMIPHMALGAELTKDSHERSQLYGARHVFYVLGCILALGSMFLFIKAGQGGNDALYAVQSPVVLSAAVLCIVFALFIFGTRERRDSVIISESGFFKKFGDVWSNRHARIVLIVTFMANLGAAGISVMTIYFAQYVVGNPLIAPVFVLSFMVPAMLSVGFWVKLSKKYGKPRLWFFALISTGICFLGFFFTPFIESYSVRLLLVFAVTIAAGFINGCTGTMEPAILGDVVDADEHATGERKEGAYFAILQTVVKAATGVMMILTGFALQFSGFVPNQEQTMQVKLTITAINGLLPFLCYIVGAWIFRHYELTPEEHARIRTALDQRQAESLVAR